MKRARNPAGDRRRRKMFTILWTAVLALGTIVMIYREMTALLYILATIGVTALLVVVAMSDLARAERISTASPSIDDSAAIGSGITSTTDRNPSRSVRW
jgi:Flp pilus assembly protein TadB